MIDNELPLDDWAESLLADLELPEHIRTEVLACLPHATHSLAVHIVVWDEDLAACTRCGQSLGASSCPVVLDGQDRTAMTWDRTHGCGAWNSVPWASVDVGRCNRDDPDDLPTRLLAVIAEVVGDKVVT